MNYDTFVNSAFIVQGRADEFTQKKASERKEILSRTGLGRHDQLQAWRGSATENMASKTPACRRLELDTQLLGATRRNRDARGSERLQNLDEEIAAQEKDRPPRR